MKDVPAEAFYCHTGKIKQIRLNTGNIYCYKKIFSHNYDVQTYEQYIVFEGLQGIKLGSDCLQHGAGGRALRQLAAIHRAVASIVVTPLSAPPEGTGRRVVLVVWMVG